jgi:hypothetical protein
MALTKRKNNVDDRPPYWMNPDIHLVHELQYKKELIKPGIHLKIKNQYSTFTFLRLVINAATGKEWIDVVDDKNGSRRSFTTDKIMGIARGKRLK